MKDDITINPYSSSPSTCGVEHIDYGDVTIYKTSVGPMDNNVYLSVDSREPNDSLSIDTATNAEHLIHLVKHAGVQMRTIVITHSRDDHAQTFGELLQTFPARHITSSLNATNIPKPTDQRLGGGETITFDQGITLPTFILRGHTKGDLCPGSSARAAGALFGDTPLHHLFVGNNIFPGGVGKTYSPKDFSQLIDDVESRVFHVYSADSMTRSGHGEGTTIGVESPKAESQRQRG